MKVINIAKSNIPDPFIKKPLTLEGRYDRLYLPSKLGSSSFAFFLIRYVAHAYKDLPVAIAVHTRWAAIRHSDMTLRPSRAKLVGWLTCARMRGKDLKKSEK
ncbi:MAG: hypothetical protein WA941_08510 [Nitrososphaeraceae archaeon]